jgi:hypothetical protein
MLGFTDVEMVSVLLWWEFAALFDYAVPAIVSAVLVDFLCRHVGDPGRNVNLDEDERYIVAVLRRKSKM